MEKSDEYYKMKYFKYKAKYELLKQQQGGLTFQSSKKAPKALPMSPQHIEEGRKLVVKYLTFMATLNLDSLNITPKIDLLTEKKISKITDYLTAITKLLNTNRDKTNDKILEANNQVQFKELETFTLNNIYDINDIPKNFGNLKILIEAILFNIPIVCNDAKLFGVGNLKQECSPK